MERILIFAYVHGTYILSISYSTSRKLNWDTYYFKWKNWLINWLIYHNGSIHSWPIRISNFLKELWQLSFISYKFTYLNYLFLYAEFDIFNFRLKNWLETFCFILLKSWFSDFSLKNHKFWFRFYNFSLKSLKLSKTNFFKLRYWLSSFQHQSLIGKWDHNRCFPSCDPLV